MSVGLYFDHHVPKAIADALRRRGVAVLTAFEDHSNLLPDDQLFERAVLLGRVFVSQDEDLLAITTDWLRSGRPFTGLAYFPQLDLEIGRVIDDLELVAKTQDPGPLLSHVYYLPF